MTQPSRPTVAVLSIGQMGLGIAKLLQAHEYRVITNVSDRSSATQDRARSAHIELLESDEALVTQADYILSIVPPRDAVSTARRISVALSKAHRQKELYYLDLNAISPATAKAIHGSFAETAPNLRFIDGGIIGGSPSPSPSEPFGWKRPGIPLSGQHALHDAAGHGAHLAATLNTRHLGQDVGSASGLKCCFAALSKGFTALALQSFTTASSLNVLGPLQDYLETYNPGAREKAERSIVNCTTKAYRWVEEMQQIGQCFAEQGGFEEQAQVFRQIADLYDGLADIVEKRGTEGMGSAEGVVGILRQRVSWDAIPFDDGPDESSS